MGVVDAGILEQKFLEAVRAAIAKLTTAGMWPRPMMARNLKPSIDYYRHDLLDLPEVAGFCETLASDDTIQRIYQLGSFDSSGNPEIGGLYDFWEVFFLRLLRETDGPEPPRAAFRSSFRLFRREIYSETFVWRTIDPISGVHLPDGPVRLDKLTALVPIRFLEWPEITMKQDQELRQMFFGLTGEQVAVVTTMTIHKEASPSFSADNEEMEFMFRTIAAVDALRLCRSGAFYDTGHASFQVSRFPIYRPLAYKHPWPTHVTGLYQADAVLRKRDFGEFRSLWLEDFTADRPGIAAAAGSRTGFDTAYSRFTSTYGLQLWLDDIVDLTIALESLFNPSDSQELRHRIALRAGWLLEPVGRGGDSPGAAENTIYRRVRAMYDIRSLRVHGGASPRESTERNWLETFTGVAYDLRKRGEQIELSVEAARQIVRDAISACRRLSEQPKDGPTWPLPDGFDENLVVPGQRIVWQKAAGILGRRAKSAHGDRQKDDVD